MAQESKARVVAAVTLVTADGPVSPGAEVSLEAAEAASLVERGFARPVPAAAPEATDPETGLTFNETEAVQAAIRTLEPAAYTQEGAPKADAVKAAIAVNGLAPKAPVIAQVFAAMVAAGFKAPEPEAKA